MFGRAGDIDHLIGRVRFKGLTAVVARPAMGKSWLLTELSRRLSDEHDPPYLIGFARSYGETPDLLLRAVVDLYERWLSQASYAEQAKMVWDQQQGGLLPNVAKAVGLLIKSIDTMGNPVGGLVSESLNGLVRTGDTLRSGGTTLPTLQYDEARDLLTVVNRISGRAVVIVLDQWEQSPDPSREAKTLQAFLDEPGRWPPCHVFMGLRPDPPAIDLVDGLVAGHRGPAERYDLRPMDLADAAERQRLVTAVRATVPASRESDHEALLQLVDGYPGVIGKWTDEYWRQAMTSVEDLVEVANDAWNYRYRELGELLPVMSDNQRRVAIRLALVPATAVPELWPMIRSEIVADAEEPLLDDLRTAKLLEAREPPSFGHAKRVEAIQRWLIDQRRGDARLEASALIHRLAGAVRDLSHAKANFKANASAGVLLSLLPITAELDLDALAQGLCQAAATLSSDQAGPGDALLDAAEQATARDIPSVALLLAIGLVNMLNQAKAENALKERDNLLDELRRVAARWPDKEAVREQLALGLCNMLLYAKAEDEAPRRDSLLDELRLLAAQWPEDSAIRKWVAKGIFDTLNQAKNENTLERRDALLEELRRLAVQSPDDSAVRERLATGLFNTLVHAVEEKALERRDNLLDELRTVAAQWPNDNAVLGWLAKGLVNTLRDAKAEGKPERRDSILDELRGLAAKWPDDPFVREPLARSLFITLIQVKEQNALERRDDLLDELRQLAERWPEDNAVREQLAMALFNTLIHVMTENALERRDDLLGELRQLAERWPDDDAVREWLARGLVNTLVDAKAKDELKRRDDLLDELRQLAERWPDDHAVRKNLAMGLVNTLNQAQVENARERRDDLLDELRQLAERWPDDDAVRAWLAIGLAHTLAYAKDENALDRRDNLLDELRRLATQWPDDAAVREQLARGLLVTWMESEDDAAREALWQEAVALAGAHPDDAWVPLLDQVQQAVASDKTS